MAVTKTAKKAAKKAAPRTKATNWKAEATTAKTTLTETTAVLEKVQKENYELREQLQRGREKEANKSALLSEAPMTQSQKTARRLNNALLQTGALVTHIEGKFGILIGHTATMVNPPAKDCNSFFEALDTANGCLETYNVRLKLLADRLDQTA